MFQYLKNLTNEVIKPVNDILIDNLKTTISKEILYIFEMGGCDFRMIRNSKTPLMFNTDMIDICARVLSWISKYDKKAIMTKEEIIKSLDSYDSKKFIIGANIIVVKSIINTEAGNSIYRHFSIQIMGLQANQIHHIIQNIISKEMNKIDSIDFDRYRCTKFSIERVNNDNGLLIKNNFNDLICPEKDQIIKNLNSFFEKEELFKKHHLIFNYNLLFYGKPGTGKSLLARIIANYYDAILITFNSDSAIDDFFNEWFYYTFTSEIKENKRFIFLFDEVDLILEDKQNYSDNRRNNVPEKPKTNSKLEILLKVLDGELSINNSISILTTNNIESLDSRLIRTGRIDYEINMKELSYEYAIKLLQKFNIDKKNYKKILTSYVKEFFTDEDKKKTIRIEDVLYSPSKLENHIIHFLFKK